MEILRIENAKKNFPGMEVLKDITLTVNRGEVVAILGPSGSGKSTLLRCAVFLDSLDSGEIIYEGEKAAWNDANGKTVYVSQQELKKFRSKIGIVFQNFNLFPHYSVLKNIIDAPMTVQKRSKDEITAEARELLKKMDLADRENAYPCQLSGGQQQRVSIARALAMKPDILFFDEPTSALDPELTKEILKVIRKLAEEKMTMVIVTHEIEFARSVADKVVFMADGVIVEEGRPEDIIDNPSTERARAFLAKQQE